MKSIKEILKGMFGDNDYDTDLARVLGFALAVVGVVGHFLNLDATTNKWLITTGACLVLGKSTADVLGA